MASYAFCKNRIMPLSEANVGIMTHALHYGTACFDGIRGNWNAEEKRMYVFRMREHYERLFKSCHIMKISIAQSLDFLCDVTLDLVRKSEEKQDIYIRPLAYKSSETVGVRMHGLEDDLLIFITPFGPYLDLDKGARCCISSWRRVDDNMIPARAKVAGLYVNSAIAKTEAWENGYDEAIFLNQDGHVSEGTGENMFMIVGGKIITPPPTDNILVGITRDSVIELAREELGIETIERPIDRSELYIADECFMTGTAAHVTPVVEIDHRNIGDGRPGKISAELQRLYFDVIRGNNMKYSHWVINV